jgi:integral membrane sensor domain MASE1
MEKLINHFTEKQKTLFLVDSIGAFITATFLFVIVQQFNAHFGMPKKDLRYLSVIAVLYCIYSAFCFLFLNEGLTPFIRFIGIANLIYCAFTIGLLIKYNSLLTIIETIYFLSEVVIICGLSYVELKVAAKTMKNRKLDN